MPPTLSRKPIAHSFATPEAAVAYCRIIKEPADDIDVDPRCLKRWHKFTEGTVTGPA